MKVVPFLGKAGLLATLRGRGGGLDLTRPPATIKVGAVVRATGGSALPAECFDDESNACAIVTAYRLRGALAKVVATFHAVIDGYRLADLTRNRRPLARLPGIPARTGGPA